MDLCKTCTHYWVDFPLPLEYKIPHCEIVDSKVGWKCLDDVVPYPCEKCPYDSYIKKK